MTSTTTEPAVRCDRDADGVVTLTLDDPGASANTMNTEYQTAMHDAVDRLYAEVEDVVGVVVTSAKKTFFAGADLKGITGPVNAETIFATLERVKADLRRLETYPRPVVAAINGAALGGGLEIALAANHRIAVDGRYDIGLPESQLGILPGGGGVTRVVRMLGIQPALMDVLLPGTRFRPSDAQAKGLVDEVVAADELIPAAKAWIVANLGDAEAAKNPWDRDGFRIPAATHGAPSSPSSSRCSRRCCASRPRVRTTTRLGRSCPVRSRAPRSTSTRRHGSSRAISPSWPSGSRRRT